MDDRDDDDKRRLMTAPEEWGGEQDADDNTDWLNEAAPEDGAEDEPPADGSAAKPLIDESGWLTADNAPPEPVFPAPENNTEPEADWFSENDLSSGTDTSAGDVDRTAAVAPEAPRSVSEATLTPSTPLPAVDSDKPLKPAKPEIDEDRFSSEDLLTDHKVVGTGSAGKLPLWPTIAGALAVVLLIMGGWGAVNERTALQARIVELEQQNSRLQRPLADVGTEEEKAALQAENASLRVQLDSLRGQYTTAQSEIEALRSPQEETVSEADEPATADLAMAAPEATTTPTAEAAVDDEPPAVDTLATPAVVEPEPATTAEPPPAPTGSWFVNVAAYSKPSTADEMAGKLRDEGFNAITQTVDSGGRTLYRVRAVGFASQSEARDIAGELELQYRTGPLWVGKDDAPPTPAREPERTESAPAPEGAEELQTEATNTPLSLPSVSDSGWFIYVDTYDKGLDADNKAQEIEDAGFAAKVAVEYRSGELFYRVQIVGIASREEGEAIIETLGSRGDMPNLQLRQY